MGNRIDKLLNEKVHILLCDDKEPNLFALSQTLGVDDYEIRMARSGEEALSLAAGGSFACILLDVRMPVMDGYQVAEKLRQTEKSRYTPIIFVTAEATRQNEEFEGYHAGAVDYLIKPLVPHVVRAKVRIFADLSRQKNALYQSRLIEKLYDDLNKSHEELQRLTFIASHDMREPVRKLRAFMDLHTRNLTENKALYDQSILDKMKKCLAEHLKTVDNFRNLTTVASAPVGLTRISLKELTDMVFRDYISRFKERRASVQLLADISLFVDIAQFGVLIRAITDNALLHTGDHAFNLTVLCEESPDGSVSIRFENSGSSMSPEKQNLAFQPMKKLSSFSSRAHSGMGLTLVRQIVKNHGGDVWIDSAEDYFALCMELPKPAESRKISVVEGDKNETAKQ